MTILQRIALRATKDLFRTGDAFYLTYGRRLYSKTTVKVNDVILLKQKNNDGALAVLSRRLRPGGKIRLEGSRESIAVDDVIGKGVRDLVATNRGTEYRILQPSLAEYVDLSPRIVTPIYSQDANLIVSLLDLHPIPPDDGDGTKQERLEIFEAGTGHGALTLYLARAIHGANTAAPPFLEDILEHKSASSEMSAEEKEEDESVNSALEAQARHDAYDKWRRNRRAVIHTLDISEKHSSHAKIIVKNFREGMYFPNVDFHVGRIDGYITGRLVETPETAFDHAVLDLPNTQDFLEIVSKALKSNGTLITFCPSITQINTCLLLAKDKKLPLFMEKVLEFGSAIGVGGREWDVRLVKPRATMKADTRRPGKSHQGVEASGNDEKLEAQSSYDISDSSDISETHSASTATPVSPGLEMVCRPKVGGRIAGGGFLGVWRKKV